MRPLSGLAVTALLLQLAAPAQGASAAGPDQVVEGAKRVGQGVEQTARGVGQAVTEGAREVGQRARAAGRDARPAADRLHDSAKGFGEALWGGLQSAGRALQRLVTGK